MAILIMLALALALTVVAYFSGGGLHWVGLKTGGKMMWEVLPLLLVAAFIIAGMVKVLVPREFISKWLGQEAGVKGIMIGCIAGAITPMEAALIGPKFTIIRFASTLVFPPLAGMIAQVFFSKIA